MDDVIRLSGARVALDANRTASIDLRIRRGRILPFGENTVSANRYDLSGYLLLPGLINAHDHLQFSLFPRLGKGPWKNSRDWAEQIHTPDTSPVREHRAVPNSVRLLWGAVRNLLSGVTTVAHHDPFEGPTARALPVRVVRNLGWAHSLDFSPDIVELRRHSPPGRPFVVHAAEGADDRAATELTRLDALGVIDDRTVLVHAIAATPAQLEMLRERGASIVWCPSSNLFMFGRTLDPEVFRGIRSASLGTDSALTADGDLIDEIRIARRFLPNPGDCYQLVTENPAHSLRLTAGEGSICSGGVADFVAVRDLGQTPAVALMNLSPELVIRGGRVVVVSENFPANRKIPAERGRMYGLDVEGRGRFLIHAHVPRIYRAAANVLGSEIRLAGKRVLPFAA